MSINSTELPTIYDGCLCLTTQTLPGKHDMKEQHLGHSGRIGLGTEVLVHQRFQISLHAPHHGLAIFAGPDMMIAQVSVDLARQRG